MLLQALRRPVRFLVCGGAATTAHWLSMSLLILAGAPAAWATACGALIGAVVNYPLQQRVTFGFQTLRARYMLAYGVVCILGWLANLLLFLVLHAELGLSAVAAQLVTTALVALLNYALCKTWVFRNRAAASCSETAH